VRDLRHENAASASQLADYIVYLDIQGKSPKTLYGYVRAIAPLLRAHPEKGFAEFTHLDVMGQLQLVPRPSRHISRSIYNGWFQWGFEQELLERNPMFKVPKIVKPSDVPKDVFTPAERLLLEGLPAPDGPLFTILFGAGLRRSEARFLRREHIDLDRAMLTATGKGRGGMPKVRQVPLPVIVLAAVADLDLFERLEPHEHLWYLKKYSVGDRRRRRDMIGYSTFQRWWEDKIAEAGVRYLNPHQTRHTYGYWLRDRGFSLHERAVLMGHEDVRTTSRYDRLTADDLTAKVALL
jgi:integrase/recombinase XerD